MKGLDDAPLGKQVSAPLARDPALLFPLPRAASREAAGLEGAPAAHGCDIWHAWELSWLEASGRPRAAIARFIFDARSPNIIESKSFKLYLNSLAQTRWDTPDALCRQVLDDLGAASGMKPAMTLFPASGTGLDMRPLAGADLDALDVTVDHYAPPQPEFLACRGTGTTEETLVSRAFRANCPVTGQPDWASVQISYRGRALDPAGLVRYLASFRLHSGFHEQCVETIFHDISTRCRPEALDVHACFTRRGGLDISPWRSSRLSHPPHIARTPRQ